MLLTNVGNHSLMKYAAQLLLIHKFALSFEGLPQAL